MQRYVEGKRDKTNTEQIFRTKNQKFILPEIAKNLFEKISKKTLIKLPAQIRQIISTFESAQKSRTPNKEPNQEIKENKKPYNLSLNRLIYFGQLSKDLQLNFSKLHYLHKKINKF